MKNSVAIMVAALVGITVLGNNLFAVQNPVVEPTTTQPSDPTNVSNSKSVPEQQDADVNSDRIPLIQSADPNKPLELTFDDLKFEIEKGAKFERTMLTPKINDLDKKTVRLRGYIRPSFSQSGLKKFVFVRDNKECCFGPGAALYDCVLVTLTKGTDTDFTVRPVTIEGKVALKEYLGPDDKVWAIYRLSDAQLK